LEETVYFLDYQGVRLISLNSNQRLDEQALWLDRVLAENSQTWTIVTMHHPIHSAKPGRDNKALRDILQPLFDKHRVDLVLQGHDHAYMRTGLITAAVNEPERLAAEKQSDPPAPDANGNGNGGDAVPPPAAVQQEGTVYVVSVSGPKMYDVGWRPFVRSTAYGVQLFQIIHIDGRQLRYEARLATGAVHDSFTLKKHAGQPNELIESR
jgi:3',5'-cyclic AMP phosphodiesterase CpdA